MAVVRKTKQTWDKKTFIHVIDVSSSPFKQEGSFLFSEDETPQGKLLQGETLENMDCVEFSY